jgi:hypothetical protein
MDQPLSGHCPVVLLRVFFLPGTSLLPLAGDRQLQALATGRMVILPPTRLERKSLRSHKMQDFHLVSSRATRALIGGQLGEWT